MTVVGTFESAAQADGDLLLGKYREAPTEQLLYESDKCGVSGSDPVNGCELPEGEIRQRKESKQGSEDRTLMRRWCEVVVSPMFAYEEVSKQQIRQKENEEFADYISTPVGKQKMFRVCEEVDILPLTVKTSSCTPSYSDA